MSIVISLLVDVMMHVLDASAESIGSACSVSELFSLWLHSGLFGFAQLFNLSSIVIVMTSTKVSEAFVG